MARRTPSFSELPPLPVRAPTPRTQVGLHVGEATAPGNRWRARTATVTVNADDMSASVDALLNHHDDLPRYPSFAPYGILPLKGETLFSPSSRLTTSINHPHLPLTKRTSHMKPKTLNQAIMQEQEREQHIEALSRLSEEKSPSRTTTPSVKCSSACIMLANSFPYPADGIPPPVIPVWPSTP